MSNEAKQTPDPLLLVQDVPPIDVDDNVVDHCRNPPKKEISKRLQVLESTYLSILQDLRQNAYVVQKNFELVKQAIGQIRSALEIVNKFAHESAKGQEELKLDLNKRFSVMSDFIKAVEKTRKAEEEKTAESLRLLNRSVELEADLLERKENEAVRGEDKV